MTYDSMINIVRVDTKLKDNKLNRKIKSNYIISDGHLVIKENYSINYLDLLILSQERIVYELSDEQYFDRVKNLGRKCGL